MGFLVDVVVDFFTVDFAAGFFVAVFLVVVAVFVADFLVVPVLTAGFFATGFFVPAVDDFFVGGLEFCGDASDIDDRAKNKYLPLWWH